MSQYSAARLPVLVCLFLLISFCGQVSAFERIVHGVITDPDGRTVPRALVVAEPGGISVFTDEQGRFSLTVPDVPAACTLTVRLAGFAETSSRCDSIGPMRIALAVAPIQDAVIVSATRTAAPAGQVGASATVFSEAAIERRQTPLVADLLRSAPGVMIVRSGAPGSLTSMFVRGGESDYNKVLIDGIPINEPGGIFYWNNLSTENLERVEIVRGAYSSLFGSDAMSSVVQLFTKRPVAGSARPTASVQLDGGTYDTLHGSVAAAGTAGGFDYSVGAARLQSDNRVPNNRLENTTLSANLGVSLNPGATLRVVARGELENAGTPGPTAFGRPDLDAHFERSDAVFGVTYDHAVHAGFRQRLAYSSALSHQTSTNLLRDEPYVASFQGRTALFASSDFLVDSRNRLQRHHAGYQADWRPGTAGNQLVTIIADWNGERAVLEDRLAATRATHRRDNFGAAAQHQLSWRRMFTTAGARIERNENFGSAFIPRGSVVFVVHEASPRLGETRIRFSAGAGVKEPTILESFSTSVFFRGNPDLEPERSRSFEAGLEQRLAGDRVRIDVAGFHNRFTNIISLRSDPVTFEGQYFNVGVTRVRGIEFAAEAAPVPALRAWGSYTLLDSQILESTAPDNELFAVGAWAFRRPRHSGSAGVTVSAGRTTLDVTGVFIGRFVDSDFGLFAPPFKESPGHTSWDARLAVAITTRLTGLISVDNVTDADYSEPFGYQPLGRAVRAGVRLRF